MKQIIKKIAGDLGYHIAKKDTLLVKDGMPIDIMDQDFSRLYRQCQPYTFTSVEPMYSLYQSVKYVLDNNIPGDFVECGVWKGGSAMLIAKILAEVKVTDRKIYLYDTFEGMSEPTGKDVDFKGDTAVKLMNESDKFAQRNVWCYSTLEEVQNNLFSTGYPKENIVFVKGKVEDTIPATAPVRISLLRLDTDWYESTYHELLHLYPLLSVNGVLIIDDYGHWKGAREATDDYFKKYGVRILLNRIDYSVRTGIKTA
ncbi:MAG: TylF/MycF/NovP-related O-methyltransferase [Bacteroidia bacterium]